jgi:folate-binding protein YgfZ
MSSIQISALGSAQEFERDYQAVTSAVGLRPAVDRVLIRALGDDRAAFLHGMTSGNITGAHPGDIVPALILTEHAHVIAEVFMWILDSEILIDAEAQTWPRVRDHLEKLLVADDVEFETASLELIDIEGPLSADAANIMVAKASALAQWKHAAADSVRAGHLPRVGSKAFSIIVAQGSSRAAIEAITVAIPASREVGIEAIEAVRIENGVARVGKDTTDKTIALEARMERAISFNKGCYLGQETIERAVARGSLKKKMFALKFHKDTPPPAGETLMLDGREVGQVTSSILSPRRGAIGLAMLHHRAWSARTRLVTAGGADAETVEIGAPIGAGNALK